MELQLPQTLSQACICSGSAPANTVHAAAAVVPALPSEWHLYPLLITAVEVQVA